MPLGVMSEPSVITESVMRGANSFAVITLGEVCSAGKRVPCVVFYATRELSCSADSVCLRDLFETHVSCFNSQQ